jgi:hypothetical protein
MAITHARHVRYTDPQIDELLLELNHEAINADTLPAWVASSGIAIDRLCATCELVYIRLTDHDADGGTIVLMLLDGTWERTL